MRCVCFSCFLGTCLAFLAGCSSPTERYTAELRSGLKGLNEMHFIFKKVKQKENVAGIQGELREISDKLTKIKAKIDEAEPKDEKLKEKILKSFSPLHEGILENIAAEQQRVNGMEPIGADAKQAVDKVMTEYKKLVRKDKDKTK
jgi:hypothetical protein